VKVYLLVYGGGDLVTRDDMATILDECPAITDWRSDLPFSFYLHSNESATALSDWIKLRIGGQTRLFVSEISENSDGIITKDSWYFIFAPADVEQSHISSTAEKESK
jgi:hypothetical protein